MTSPDLLTPHSRESEVKAVIYYVIKNEVETLIDLPKLHLQDYKEKIEIEYDLDLEHAQNLPIQVDNFQKENAILQSKTC